MDKANQPKKSKRGGARKGAGRPKSGQITTTFVAKASPEYKAWMVSFTKFLGGSEMVEVFREAMRVLAQQRGFRPPPLK